MSKPVAARGIGSVIQRIAAVIRIPSIIFPFSVNPGGE